MPKVEQKQQVISAIKDTMEGSSSIVVVDYRGLSVEQDTQLRKELREANVTYKVFKNTMMRFAFKETDYAQLDDVLAGPSALAISYDDPVAGPRILKKAAKDMQALEFKAGVVEGVLYDADGLLKIASIPSREEMLSKLLGSFKSPMAAFARTMKALSDKMTEENVAVAGDLAGNQAATPVEAEASDAEAVVTDEKVETEETAE